jgi:hypothetical protein
MIINVELRAFRQSHEPLKVRPVTILDDVVINEVLNAVFHNGQNNFQPLEYRSVSVGDVILHGDKRVLVEDLGFKELNDDEYNLLK